MLKFPPVIRTLNPRTIVLFGDSIMAQHDTGDATFGSASAAPSATFAGSYTKGYFNQFQMRAKQPFRIISNAGVSGDTTSNMLARVNSSVVALNPGWCLVAGGTNDPANSVPTATSISNLKQIYQTLQNAGINIIAATVMPQQLSAAGNLQIATINDFIKDYAADNPGILAVDLYPYVMNMSSYSNSTGGYAVSADFSDGVHPNAVGGLLLGQTALYNALAPYLYGVPRRNTINTDGSSAGDTNGIFANSSLVQGSGGSNGTGSSGTVAQNWACARNSGAISGTNSIVTRASVASTFPGLFDDGIQGYLQHIALSGATSASDTFSISAQPATSPGSGTGPWVIECEFGANATSGTLGDAQLIVSMTCSPNSLYLVADADVSGSDYLGASKWYGVIRSREFYVPPGYSSMYMTLNLQTSSGGAVDCYIGNMQMRKLQA